MQELDVALILILSSIILWAIIRNRWGRYVPFLMVIGVPFLFVEETGGLPLYVALAQLPVITFFNTRVPERFVRVTGFSWKYFAISFIVLVTAIEAGSIGKWILQAAVPTSIFGDPSWYFVVTSDNLFYILNLLSLFLVLLMVYSFLLIPFRDSIIKNIRRIDLDIQAGSRLVGWFYSKSGSRYVLPVLIAMAVAIPYYPNLPAINPAGDVVGTDFAAYEQRLGQADPRDPVGSIFAQVSDRPIAIIILYYLNEIIPADSATVFKIVPSLLTPITLLVSYKIVGLVTGSKKAACLAGLFSIVSHFVTVGVYGGFFANWVTIIMMLAIFYFLIRETRSHSYLHYAAVAALSVLAMFTHIYGWTYIVAILVGYTLFSFLAFRRSGTKKDASIAILAVIIVGNIAGDYAKLQFIGTSSGIESDVSLAESSVSTEAFSQRYNNLKFMLTTYFGGFLSNPVIFILVIIWTLKARIGIPAERLLLSSIYVAAPVFLVSDYLLQSRLLFMMPLPIAASLVVFDFAKNKKTSTVLILLLIASFLISNVLRSMGNMVFVSPQ